MKISNRQYAIALYQSLVDCSSVQQSERIINFIKILVRDKRLKSAQKILNKFKQYYFQQKNIIEVQATVAKTVDEIRLKQDLTKILDNNIELKLNFDPSILAGLVLKIEDTLIDGSINNKLNLLKNKLINN